MEAGVITSVIEPEKAKIGSFGTKHFGNKMLIGYYHGS